VDRSRVRVFIGYSKIINKQFKFYLLELGYTLRLSYILVDKHIPRRRVKLQLQNILARLQGILNTILD
jgi:hypothetical protein